MKAHIPQMPGQGMKDPFGSMQGFMKQFQGFAQNPMQFFAQNKLNLPQNINPMQDPQAAIQYLMNSGTMTQEQYNGLQTVAKQITSNPQFAQMMQIFRR